MVPGQIYMNFKRGDRVKVILNGSYRHYLDGLVGTVTGVLRHSVIVALDFDPITIQRLIVPGGDAPDPSTMPQRLFPFHELEKLP